SGCAEPPFFQIPIHARIPRFPEVHCPNATLRRETSMSSFLLKLTTALMILIALLVPAWIGYRSTLAMRNLRVVREGVLYRSGQMSISGLRRAAHDLDIKTVISLRDAHRPGEAAPDGKEETFCNKEEIAFHRIVLGRWYAEDGTTPAKEG